jgi:hypothetical protein
MTFSHTTIKIYGTTALVKTDVALKHPEDTSYLHTLWVLLKGPQGWQVSVRHPSRLPENKPRS